MRIGWFFIVKKDKIAVNTRKYPIKFGMKKNTSFGFSRGAIVQQSGCGVAVIRGDVFREKDVSVTRI